MSTPDWPDPMDGSPAAISRRRFLTHTAWAGAAVVVAVTGGEVFSNVVGRADAGQVDFTFAQISDSHLGFLGAANHDVAGSFGRAIAAVNALPRRPDFVIHTGDLTHFSTPAQFDQAKQMMQELKTGRVFTVPGEHDSIEDGGTHYRAAFGAGSRGDGWYSFDLKGTHFISLVNTLLLAKLGHLGGDQVDFVRRDLAGLHNDTPIVVFSHIPLTSVYSPWGWGTDDALQVLAMMRRFSSVTCINGHIHQLFTKTEGNASFHSARATAYPLPGPGHAAAPQPVDLPAGELGTALGIRQVAHHVGDTGLAIRDAALST
jgi:3',5'-cyclic AMP phosphodiesterase CpdA